MKWIIFAAALLGMSACNKPISQVFNSTAPQPSEVKAADTSPSSVSVPILDATGATIEAK